MKHLAVILDGNRRWAKKNKKHLWMGHRKGSKTFEDFLNWALELNIPKVSAWVLSTENLDRPKRELDEIFKIAIKNAEKWLNDGELFDKYEVKIKFIGDFRRLPPPLVKLMKKLMKRTEKYQKKALNILVAYGGQAELTRVMKKMAKKVLKSGRIQITKKDIEDNLMIDTPVDLIIRTGGMHRLSNFMLWQTAYAEMYVTKTLWPDFSKKELIKAIKWYNKVQRNFGR